MKLTTRKQRNNFDVRSDLLARQKARLLLSAVFKGHTVRATKPKPTITALVRTQAFIECKHCSFKNTKYEDNCVKCDTVLSTRPAILKAF